MKIKHIAIGLLSLILLALIVIVVVNIFITNTAQSYIVTDEYASDITDVDAILILGCRVHNETPSDILKDRLIKGVELYNLNPSTKLLMSGDHGQEHYDEVTIMKQFAVDTGVPSEDIFLDHSGFSTYESMYRAKEIFGIDKVIIVTQEYHLYRAVYIARSLGIEAYGVQAEDSADSGQGYGYIREIFARCKDFAYSIFKPAPTHLGSLIDIAGNGDVTNNK